MKIDNAEQLFDNVKKMTSDYYVNNKEFDYDKFCESLDVMFFILMSRIMQRYFSANKNLKHKDCKKLVEKYFKHAIEHVFDESFSSLKEQIDKNKTLKRYL